MRYYSKDARKIHKHSKIKQIMEEEKMKKIFAILIAVSLISMLCACGDQEKGGTYYPDLEEMRSDLNAKGYTVTATSRGLLGDGSDAQYTGSYLSATKGEEHLIFYWLDEADAVGYFAKQIEQSGVSYNKFVTLADDEEFGSLICCGTEKAIEDAGIRIVDVKVNVG